MCSLPHLVRYTLIVSPKSKNNSIICGIVGIIQNQSIMLLTNQLLLNQFRLINHLQYLIQIELFEYGIYSI